MAQKVNIVLVDDLDGSEAEETVTFGLDGATYEIDLSAAHAAGLREALAGYVGAARKVTGPRRRNGRRASTASAGTSTSDIRDWARANGYTVSERGRISADIQSAYAAAH